MRASVILLWSVVLFALTACGPARVATDDGGEVPAEEDGGAVADAGEQPDAGVTPDAGEDAGSVSAAPDTELTSGPSGTVARRDAALAFTSPSAGAGFECSLDNAPFAPCGSPVVLQSLSEGPHAFRVRAVVVGVVDASPATALWTVDTLAPDTTITSGPYATVQSSSASFGFASSEQNGTFECALDGAAFSACTSPASFTALANGQHTFEVRATDVAGNVDATPALRAWTIDPGSSTRLRIVAANLTSGNLQSYDPGHGARILDGLNPDVVLIQEFNYGDNSAASITTFVQSTFGPGYVWHRESGGKQIPNGVISRFPIVASGVWDDPKVSNRDFAWAKIDLPGSVDLWAVSVHLLTSDATTRNAEATSLRQFINANVPAGDYLVIGGDFNTDSRTEACLSTLGQIVVTQGPWPADQSATGGTNASRSKPYDWVLPDPDLEAHQVPVEIGAASFASGLVFDSRVYSPLSDVTPVLSTDSGATNMQHMAVVRDFVVPN